jgi:predicted nucleic acid-binding protein
LRYLIDTNVISELQKGDRRSPAVTRWYASVPEASLYLSALVIGEIRKGIENLRDRDDVQAEALELWLAAVKEAFSGRILPVDETVSEMWGRLNAIRPLPAVDSLLAATAKIYNLTLVTRNTKQIADLSIDLLNPFEA